MSSPCSGSPCLKGILRITTVAVGTLAVGSLNQQWVLSGCQHPLHIWLFIAYALVCVFLASLLTGCAAECDRSWWFVQPRTAIGRGSFVFTWAILLPSLTMWTIIGLRWLSESLELTPDCFPSEGRQATPTAVATVQVLCGFGVAAYAVFVWNVWSAARCLRLNATALSFVEDDDSLRRWGVQRPSASNDEFVGLHADEFLSLPRHLVAAVDQVHCAICLAHLAAGDVARKLPGCGHEFHRPCIDLWLLRIAKCPLCNAEVRMRRSTSSGTACS